MREADEHRALPPDIVEIVARVLDASGLDFVDGRAEVEQELLSHFEDGLASGTAADVLIARFGDPVAAGRRIARTRPRAAARNRGEHGRWWMSPKEWWDEVRRAARRLGRAPGFAAIVILTLGLGVGANTAIFAVLDAVLLEELPYAEPERLVRVYENNEERPQLQFIRAPVVAEWMRWHEVFEEVGALYTYREVGADLTSGSSPRRITVMRASTGYFETLGVAPERGRTFEFDESLGPGEAGSTTTPIAFVAILSHDLWASEYGGASDIIGRTIVLDGASFEVVGVMPRGFNNPFGTRADLWVPQDLRSGGANRFGNYYLSAVARLRDGLTLEVAQERLKTLAAAFAEQEPRMQAWFPTILPLQDDVVGSTRRAMLLILAGAAGLVLLTACLNVANLLFARGLDRDRDLALRSALGSSRGRLIAGILTENGLLAAGGGIFGLLIGWSGVRALLWLAPDALPMVAEVELGSTVFLFALSATVAALVIFGLMPALRLSRTAPADVLRSGDRASTVGRFARRLRDVLVMLQVAAALVLVAGATLLTRSFGALTDVPLGIESEGVLTFEVNLPTARYADREARDQFHSEFQDRVAALPGVDAVGATSWLPVKGRYHSWGFAWDAQNPDNPDAPFQSTDVRVITGDYFGVMGIELLSGTDPTEIDLAAEPVMWINQELAETVFQGIDPIGLRVNLAGADRPIMGVVESVSHSARGAVSPKSYIPHASADSRNWALIQTVRARADLNDVREQIRAELASIDPQLVMYRTQTFEEVLGTVRAQDRFATVLMGAFAVLALILSLVGTYGVLAGSVASRTREIGIRMALGADAGSVRKMVLRYAAALTIPGVALGLFGAWVGGRWIEALLFEIEAADPATYLGAVAIFLAMGLFSGWLPAERATRVDTVRTLTAQ